MCLWLWSACEESSRTVRVHPLFPPGEAAQDTGAWAQPEPPLSTAPVEEPTSRAAWRTRGGAGDRGGRTCGGQCHVLVARPHARAVRGGSGGPATAPRPMSQRATPGRTLHAMTGMQTARDLQSCSNCGHARSDHRPPNRGRKFRGPCEEDGCECPAFKVWRRKETRAIAEKVIGC
mgnify:CR=1 FL=1